MTIISLPPLHSKSFFYSRSKNGPISGIFVPGHHKSPLWYREYREKKGKPYLYMTGFVVVWWFDFDGGIGLVGCQRFPSYCIHFTHAFKFKKADRIRIFRVRTLKYTGFLRIWQQKLDLSGISELAMHPPQASQPLWVLGQVSPLRFLQTRSGGQSQGASQNYCV